MKRARNQGETRRPPGEHDGGQHRPAEEGAEADGVAAHRVGCQPDERRGEHVGGERPAQLALLVAQAAGDEERRRRTRAGSRRRRRRRRGTGRIRGRRGWDQDDQAEGDRRDADRDAVDGPPALQRADQRPRRRGRRRRPGSRARSRRLRRAPACPARAAGQRSEASPKATPRAKVSWPSASRVTTPAANQRVAQRAGSPQRSRTRRSKR